MPREEIMDRALREWGEDTQIDMVIEEMAELTHALLKYKRAMSSWHLDEVKARLKVAEEHADVTIMLDQLAYIMGQYDMIGADTYLASKKKFTIQKVTRLVNRLDEWVNQKRLHV